MVAQTLLTGAAFCVSSCLDDKPAIEAKPQRIIFDAPPTPSVDADTAVASAHASSGLPVSYNSRSPEGCSVDQTTGIVAAASSGTCTIEATQLGDAEFAPAPPATQSITFQFSASIHFDVGPVLGLYDLVKVEAIATSGATIVYSTSTPLVCSVDPGTGVVVALSLGTCSLVATAGTLRAEQTVTVEAPKSASAPAVPLGVTATSVGSAHSIVVMAQTTASGASPITSYSVSSVPAGIVAKGTTLPIAVSCPSGCAGNAFALSAHNAFGTSPPSAAVDVVSDYAVTTVFHEPDTRPNDTIFVGQYRLDSTTGVVTGLSGRLSEAMTGSSSAYPNDTMNWLALGHQLASQPVELDGASGLLVTTFLLTTTNTFTDSPSYGGGNGWTPGTGFGLHYGYPGSNPGNAYVTVFVNVHDPLAAPTSSQLARLAYADCAPGGMMGATCMTGTSIAGHGSLGTMGGTPSSQITVQQ